MKTLEIRRHTMRKKPGKHLSDQGIALANMTGAGSGPFDLVITSDIPRAIETAIAMGHAVHRTIDTLGEMPPKTINETGWPTPFSKLVQILDQKGHAFRFAHDLAELIQDIAHELPPAGKGLIITHGGFIELIALAISQNPLHILKEKPFGYCEGVRLKYHDDNISVEFLRVPKKHYQLEN